MTWPLDNHPTAFGVYAIGLGVLIVGVVVFFLLRGSNSRRWPTAEALITQVSFAEDSDGQFSVDVTFAYRAGGLTHTRTENLTVWLPTRENAERTAAEYPVGSSVGVRCCPSRPEVAVLRPGTSANEWIWLTVGVGIVAAGIGLLAGVFGS